MPTLLRPATAADLSLLLTFMQEFYAYEHLDFEPEAARKALLRLLRDETLGQAWLIQHEEEPVGYVVLVLGYSLEFHGHDAFVDELYLRAAYRGSGLGTRALRDVAIYARQ